MEFLGSFIECYCRRSVDMNIKNRYLKYKNSGLKKVRLRYRKRKSREKWINIIYPEKEVK